MEVDLKHVVPLPLAVMSCDPYKISWTSAKHFFSAVVEDHLPEHADPFQAQETTRFWDEKPYQFCVI